MTEKINVAISVTWRVECLNVLLDILKNNFVNEYRTIVFCNVSKTEKRILEKIDMSLIDNFVHIPSEEASLESQKIMTNRKLVTKRFQPAQLWSGIMKTLSANDIESFIYTECDFFPLDEKAYTLGLKKVKEGNFACKFIENEKGPKVPHGYLCPCPMYFGSSKTAERIADSLDSFMISAVQKGYAFEGMMAKAVRDSKIPYFSTSNVMISNQKPDCLDPNTKTIHMHNVMNLRDTLLQYGITSGRHIKDILEKDEIKQVWDGNILTREINRVLGGPIEE